MKKIYPIKPLLVAEWKDMQRQAAAKEEQIINRIDYILHFWFETYGAKLEYWYFDGAAEGEIGDIKMDNNTIWNFYTEVKNFPDNDMIFIDKDGDEYTWQSEIPTRWLYNDFEDEIINGKAEYERLEIERLAKKKLNSLAKKEINDKLVAQAKLKLSKEELAALKKAL